jgi:hypothetical protein
MSKRIQTTFLSVRLRPIVRLRLGAISKVYGAGRGTFVRDLVEAVILENPAKRQAFFDRFNAGMEKYRARALGVGSLGLTAPGQEVEEARRELAGRPTKAGQ